MNDPEHQFAFGHHTDRYAPERNAGQKIVRAVDRVDHPDRRRIGIVCASLLAEKAVVWE